MTSDPPPPHGSEHGRSGRPESAVFYLPGLNGIRAIAALIVIVFHIDQYSDYFGLPSIGFYKNGMARYGVTLFFVLSGYLITYLLLLEKKKFGSIDLLRFYTRRILRIWPIYYLCIIVAIFMLVGGWDFSEQENDVWLTIALYILLLSNVGFAFGFQLTPITPLWSVGVEEQFYAFWPLLIRKARNVVAALWIVIGIYLVLKVGLRLYENGPIYNLVKYSLFSAMAIGAMGAHLCVNKSRLLSIIYHPIAQLIAWSVLLISILYKPFQLVSIFDHELNAVFYMIIIVNVSTNTKSIVNLENKVLDFVGRISYGIYVYHMLLILFLSWIWTNFINLPSNVTWMDYALVYFSTITMTIVVAHLSFHYVESFFLSLKSKYARIASSASKVLSFSNT